MTSSEIQMLFREALRDIDFTTQEGRDSLLHLAWSAEGIPGLEEVLDEVDPRSTGNLEFRLNTANPSPIFSRINGRMERRRRPIEQSDDIGFARRLQDTLKSLRTPGEYWERFGSEGSTHFEFSSEVSLAPSSPQPLSVLTQALFDVVSADSLDRALESSQRWSRRSGRLLKGAMELAIESRWELEVTYSDDFGRNLSFEMRHEALIRARAFAQIIEGPGRKSWHHSQA